MLAAQSRKGRNHAMPVTVAVPRASLLAATNNPEVVAVAPIRNFAVSSMRAMLSTRFL